MSYPYRDPYYTDTGGDKDVPFNPYQLQNGGYSYADGGYTDHAGHAKEGVRSAFDQDDHMPVPVGDKTPGNVRRWRKDYQGNLWTKGSRVRCCGRFFCCTIMIFVFFLISVVLSLALWLRPPNIIVGQPTPDLSTFAINDTSISIALPIAISVNNPNYFTVTLASLNAAVIYPINTTQIGSGHMTNIDFKDHTQTNFTFPVTVAYNAAADPSQAVILDLAKHCGLQPGVAASDVTVSVDIKLGLKIMLINFSTTVTQKASFGCPLGNDISQLEDMLKALGINIGSLASLL